MADQDLRVFLENRHHRAQRHILLHQIEGDEAVGADAEIRRAARQQLRHIHLRPAGADGDVEAALGIKPSASAS